MPSLLAHSSIFTRPFSWWLELWKMMWWQSASTGRSLVSLADPGGLSTEAAARQHAASRLRARGRCFLPGLCVRRPGTTEWCTSGARPSGTAGRAWFPAAAWCHRPWLGTPRRSASAAAASGAAPRPARRGGGSATRAAARLRASSPAARCTSAAWSLSCCSAAVRQASSQTGRPSCATSPQPARPTAGRRAAACGWASTGTTTASASGSVQ
mmetsp:Transcript_23183/g.65743  ORF Transcript_23183/g.65743 Transcript_23183/m.65743 type:complete len:212 (-) Transcript_23183:188-823(-)